MMRFKIHCVQTTAARVSSTTIVWPSNETFANKLNGYVRLFGRSCFCPATIDSE